MINLLINRAGFKNIADHISRWLKNCAFILLLIPVCCWAEDGYRLWLCYDKIADEDLRHEYLENLTSIHISANTPILKTAEIELKRGLSGLLGTNFPSSETPSAPGVLAVGIIGEAEWIDGLLETEELDKIESEGYLIRQQNNQMFLVSRDDSGILYGAFQLLRSLQTNSVINGLKIIDNPSVKLRVLNHWDNLDGTVERGYAGFSIWNWHQLPEFLDVRYTDYARANASLGINGTVITNVNANSLVFRQDYLLKTKALADLFRQFGIKIYLTARFSSPMERGGLKTADPLDPDVRKWWRNTVAEIYRLIPDFGGFLVKANSEGQPGPQAYGRSHVDGANMLADALAPFGGVVMWRAFVYSNEEPEDRAKQAYNEFALLDGQFRDNVLVQVKNGPIDFQPREPIHPLFGAMPETPLMMELQITKEYLGQGTHLVGLGTMFEEILRTDTYVKGPGSNVAKIIDGSFDDHSLSGIAGVANIGSSRNWTGNLFGQADWYAFGRLAWNPSLAASTIFEEWVEMTFTHDERAKNTIVEILQSSYETCVKYMTPLGLHHIMGPGHHYGPGPWVSKMPRADWTSVYYHRADSLGLGFDRTQSGSDAISQYQLGFQKEIWDLNECPLKFLLWFHHVPWNHILPSGRNLWEELCFQYMEGVKGVDVLLKLWEQVKSHIDKERYEHVKMHLHIQEKEAKWWRDACLLYFQTFSKMEFPSDLILDRDLKYYQALRFPYAPGIRPRW